MIAVGDTGVGMPPDVVARAFEPFFTTKDVGKGTGLGLSMVYGFVKQSGGHVRIHSEVGRGTVVRLYLPRSMAVARGGRGRAGRAARAAERQGDHPVRRGRRRWCASIPASRSSGSATTVVTAENAAEALALVENGCVPDLLFTDVVMPGGMNGRQLALKLRERWPNLRVLYTSGYAHGRLTIDGESVPSKYVLGKPYRRADLAAKLREVLDEPAASGEVTPVGPRLTCRRAAAARSRRPCTDHPHMTEPAKPTRPFLVVHDDAPQVAALRGAVAAIGNFDGVHRGHRAVIDAAIARAARARQPRRSP